MPSRSQNEPTGGQRPARIGVLGIAVVVLGILGTPAKGTPSPYLLLDYAQVWPGGAVDVTLMDHAACVSGANVMLDDQVLLWIDIPPSGPVTVQVTLPESTAVGAHRLVSECKYELLPLGYGGSVPIEVVPPPPGPGLVVSTSTDVVEMRAEWLSLECAAYGLRELRLNGQLTDFTVLGLHAVTYRSTSARFAEAELRLPAPPPGSYAAELYCDSPDGPFLVAQASLQVTFTPTPPTAPRTSSPVPTSPAFTAAGSPTNAAATTLPAAADPVASRVSAVPVAASRPLTGAVVGGVVLIAVVLLGLALSYRNRARANTIVPHVRVVGRLVPGQATIHVLDQRDRK